jgi:arylsulfatase A-like enzyme/tetratricopeptide (TPR) repeat protein
MTARTRAARSRGLGVVTLILAVAVAGLAAWWYLRTPAFDLIPRADRNVLVITIDTLRGDALGSYGGRASTPHLDALASHGARFGFAHAHAVLTLPSHASILTGRYPYEHGIRDNSGFRVRAGETTLASRLKALGFATGAFVSAYPVDQRYGLNAGFDTYDDRVSEVGKTTEIAVPERRANETVASAIDWIGRQNGKWFGWVHVFDPHAPYKAPPDWQAKYPSDAYAAEVAWTDFALGPLLDRVARGPRSTLVIVTSDHGEGLGEHGEMTHGIFAYESTLHVPLVVAELGAGSRERRGVTITSPARHVDIVPTVLEAIGAPADTGLPGSSLLDVIARGGGDDRPSYFESMMPVLARGWAPLRGVLVAREKYIDLPVPELYDLAADAGEQRNVATLRTDRVPVLLRVLQGFNVAPPNRPAEESTGARERLRALGYTGGSPAPARDRYSEQDDPKRLIDLDQMMHRAREQFQAGRLPEAIDLLKQVIARRPDTADAYRNMAFMLWQSGRPGLAIATLEAALKNGVTQRDVQVRLGTYLSEVGAGPKAVPLLESLPQDDTEVLNALGIAYARSGRPADAMRLFRRALDLDATSGLAHQNIGTLHLQAGDVKAAEASLREALRIDPTLSGAYTTLGVVLVKTGRGPEAVEAWTRAIALEPTEFDALYNLTIELLAEGRIDEARTFGDQYLANAPAALYANDLAHVRKLLGR